MKWIIVVFVSFSFGCGGEEPLINKPANQCRKIILDKGPLKIPLWADPKQMLKNDFVFQSLNQYWQAAGVTVVKAESPEKALIGLIYASGGCKWPIEAGRLQVGYWAKLNSIIVDYDCFGKAGYKHKFPAAVSHALGNLMGIEAVPAYCGAGIMKKIVLMMVEEPPATLSKADIMAYWNRNDFSSKPISQEVCDEIVPEAGKFQPADFRTIRFFVDSSFRNIPVASYLNDYFALFGRDFQFTANEVEAEFKIVSWKLNKINCSPLAIAMADKREIKVRVECLDSSSGYWDETILVHETAHFFGMNHIPNWCAPAIMNPFLEPLPSFASADVLEWQVRDKSESILDANRILPVKYQGKDADFIPLSRLRWERRLQAQ